ncbi:hypothetical protein PUN4_910036 [Paraburkholderia unamae]|nr:hypothetical protein PUN4_910036 [Paraburkholderia unamae]
MTPPIRSTGIRANPSQKRASCGALAASELRDAHGCEGKVRWSFGEYITGQLSHEDRQEVGPRQSGM